MFRIIVPSLMLVLVSCGPSQKDMDHLRSDMDHLRSIVSDLKKENSLLSKKLSESETEKNRILDDQNRLRAIDGSILLHMQSGDVLPQKGVFVGIIESTPIEMTDDYLEAYFNGNYYSYPKIHKQFTESLKFVEDFYDENIDNYAQLFNELKGLTKKNEEIVRKLNDKYVEFKNIFKDYKAPPYIELEKWIYWEQSRRNGDKPIQFPIYYEADNPIALEEATRLKDSINKPLISIRPILDEFYKNEALLNVAVNKISTICDQSKGLKRAERKMFFNSLRRLCFSKTKTDLEGNFQLIIPQGKQLNESNIYTLIAFGDRQRGNWKEFECWNIDLEGPYSKPYAKVMLDNDALADDWFLRHSLGPPPKSNPSYKSKYSKAISFSESFRESELEGKYIKLFDSSFFSASGMNKEIRSSFARLLENVEFCKIVPKSRTRPGALDY